jgi:hypothetical protein
MFVNFHTWISRTSSFRVWELYFTCLPILRSSNLLIRKPIMKGSVFCVLYYRSPPSNHLTFCVFWSHFLNFGKLNIQFLYFPLSLSLYEQCLLNEFAHTDIRYLHYENTKSDVTWVFQILLDHSLFMLRWDTSVGSIQFHGGSKADSTCRYNCGIYNKGL